MPNSKFLRFLACLLLPIVCVIFMGSAVFVGVPVPLGNSGGIPCYTAAGTLSSSAAITSNALIKGGGAGACPAVTGLTVDASNNLTVPGSITTGTSGGGAVLIDGSTSGTVTVNTPATVTTGTMQLPGGSDTFLGQFSQMFWPAGAINGVRPSLKSVPTLALASGDNDLVTVPVGYKILVQSSVFYNTSAGTLTATLNFKRSGTYYKFGGGNIGAASTASLPTSIVLTAGDTLSVNASGTGINTTIRYLQFDATYPLYSPLLLSLSNGDNTLYTVPANTTAILFGNANTSPGAFDYNFGFIAPGYVNSSGGTRLVSWNAVPSGGSVSANNKLQSQNVTNNSPWAAACLPSVLNTGDFININTNASTATQIAWLTVLELPN